MVYYICSGFVLILNILNVLSKPTVTTTSLKVLNDKPLITQFLVFSSDSETIISFEPKLGWMLGEENKLRLYVSGFNLENNSIVFSASANECTSSDFISPMYRLSSASIIELDINLKGASKAHSSIFLCLIPSSVSKLNETLSENGTQLVGAYYTFLREKSRLPFPARICLILMLFVVSGFFR